MAVLSAANRQTVRNRIVDYLCTNRSEINLTKPDLVAAVDAADDWANVNAAAYNLALPLLARNNLTAKQKAMLLAYVLLRRWEIV